MELSLTFSGDVTCDVETVTRTIDMAKVQITEENKEEILEGLDNGDYVIDSLADMLSLGEANFDTDDYEWVD